MKLRQSGRAISLSYVKMTQTHTCTHKDGLQRYVLFNDY